MTEYLHFTLVSWSCKVQMCPSSSIKLSNQPKARARGKTMCVESPFMMKPEKSTAGRKGDKADQRKANFEWLTCFSLNWFLGDEPQTPTTVSLIRMFRSLAQWHRPCLASKRSSIQFLIPTKQNKTKQYLDMPETRQRDINLTQLPMRMWLL